MIRIVRQKEKRLLRDRALAIGRSGIVMMAAARRMGRPRRLAGAGREKKTG
jgi:hypothetical protein